MKNMKRYIVLLLAIRLIFCQCTLCSGYAQEAYPEISQNTFSKHACWISYIDIQLYLCDKNETAFRIKLNEMYQNICENQLNTVIIHVRAMGDACYPSKYFPFSVYMSSDRSELGYDPFQIMVETAHLWGLNVEAWINPYRISMNDETTKQFIESGYYEQYKSMILEYQNEKGVCLSLDPGNENARQLIINQIDEIVTNYDIDGIHMDDYFYIEGMQSQLSENEKKENVNILIREVYSSIKAKKPTCRFGVSPAGNPDYARSQGADIDTWLTKDGYIDYIMPQIYWTDQYVTDDEQVNMYTNRCLEWKSLNKNNTPMYVGLALYRVGEVSDVDCGWTLNQDNMKKQCEIAYQNDYKGFSLFRYSYLEDESCDEELNHLTMYLINQFGDIHLTRQPNAWISYTTHMQTYGWQQAKKDGIVSGMTRTDRQLEAICVRLGTQVQDGSVCYRTYIHEGGWQSWVRDGMISGTTGQSKYIEALEMTLTGACKNEYDICYRLYNIENGWTQWMKNNDTAGTPEKSGRFSALQVKLIKK